MYGWWLYGGDAAYLGIVIISLVLGLITQSYIKRTYAKWSQVPANTGETGAQVAERMLESAGVHNVGITSVPGTLTDNYNPSDRKLHLSSENLHGGSVASVAVACHEAGHAIQHAKAYGPLRIRTALVPVVNASTNMWMLVLMAGFFFNTFALVQLGIALFAFSVIFQLVTLPVEFDASRRAVRYIASSGLDPVAERGARQVLTAAALTYVAAALISVLQLVYLLSRTQERN